MLIRALIVLLIVLNLGVAAWWLAASSARPTQTAAANPDGVPRLQLLSEQTEVPAKVAQPADAGAGLPAVAAAQRCFSLGPFDAEGAARAAGERLDTLASVVRVRQAPGAGASAYNVFLLPAPDRTQALEAAERIGAAGFDDFLVVNTGEMTNAVALGRYSSLQGAERRQAALQAAGFAAQVIAVDPREAPQWWVDARAPVQTTAQQARALAASAQANELDCGLLL